MVKHASKTSLFMVSSIAHEERRQKYVYDLLHTAEHARLAHEYGVLEEAVKGISEVSLSHFEQGAANYYTGLLSLLKGSPAKARKLLESAAERGDSRFRARALTGLAAIQARTGDLRLAEEFYSESYLVSSSIDRDYRLGWFVYKDRCVLRSMQGDHKRAEKLLEEGLPAARMIGLHHPGFYLDWLNSLAVEKLELKRIDEAIEIMRPVKLSPLLRNFPTWQDTLVDIRESKKQASRSVVAIPNTVPNTNDDHRLLDYVGYVSQREPKAESATNDSTVGTIENLLDHMPLYAGVMKIIARILK